MVKAQTIEKEKGLIYLIIQARKGKQIDEFYEKRASGLNDLDGHLYNYTLASISKVHRSIFDLYKPYLDNDVIDQCFLESLIQFVDEFTDTKNVKVDEFGGKRTVERFINDLDEWTETDLKSFLSKLAIRKIDKELVGNKEQKTLQQILIDYHTNNNEHVLKDLFVTDNQGNWTSTYFSVKEINEMRDVFRKKHKKYIPVAEIDDQFLSFVIQFVIEKRITAFEEEDDKKPRYAYDDPVAIVDEELRGRLFKELEWAFARLVERQFGKTKKDQDGNIIGREREFSSANQIIEDENGEQKEIDYDKYVIDRFKTISLKTDYEEFLDFIEMENFLNKNQRKVYPYLRMKYSAEPVGVQDKGESFKPEKEYSFREISELLKKYHQWDITPQMVHKYDDQIRKIFMKQYFIWRTRTSKTRVPLSQSLIDFINEHKKIELMVNEEKGVLFAHLIGFMESQYTQGEQNISKKDLIAMIDHDETLLDLVLFNFNENYGDVSDVLDPELHERYMQILNDILDKKMGIEEVSNQDKVRIVKQCIKIFEQYIEDSLKFIHKSMEYAYQNNKKKRKGKQIEDKQVYAGKLYTRQVTLEEAKRYGIEISKIM